MTHAPMEKNRDGNPVPLAITGMSFEFPEGMTSDDGFWQMVHDGPYASIKFPHDRMTIDSFFHICGNRPSTGPLRGRGARFNKGDLRSFDALFFSISPGEAACLDPQQRR